VPRLSFLNVIIEVKNVTKRFGGLAAVDACSLSIERGSISGLIGPNGAGKSTLFNIVAGAYAPETGSVVYEDRDTTGLHPHQLFAQGLLRTFQIPHEFSRMSTLENLMMVPAAQVGEDLGSAWFRPGLVGRQERRVRAKADEVLEFLGLTHVRDELAGNLSGGQKKLLELGRTMMVDAKVVLLDEIAAGVNRTLLNDLVANIRRLNQELGYTFIIIEHDMDMVARLCDPVIVMVQGKVMTQGHISKVRSNPDVIDAYFGGKPND